MTLDRPVIALLGKASFPYQNWLTSPELPPYQWVTMPELPPVSADLGGEQGWIEDHQRPDLVIWATSAPSLSGVAQVRQRWTAPLLIVLPAEYEEIASLLLAAGAADYLVQAHLSPTRLRTTVQTIIDSSRLRASLRDRTQAQQTCEHRLATHNDIDALGNAGNWFFDLETGDTWWSPQMSRIHGLPADFEPDVSQGLDFYLSFYRPDSREVIRQAFIQLMEQGQGYDLELPFVTAQDQNRWVRTIAKAVMRDGKAVQLMGNLVDISDRKTLELCLQ